MNRFSQIVSVKTLRNINNKCYLNIINDSNITINVIYNNSINYNISYFLNNNPSIIYNIGDYVGIGSLQTYSIETSSSATVILTNSNSITSLELEFNIITIDINNISVFLPIVNSLKVNNTSQFGNINTLLQNVQLKNIDFSSCSLSYFSSEPLVNGIVDLNFSNCGLSTTEVDNIFIDFDTQNLISSTSIIDLSDNEIVSNLSLTARNSLTSKGITLNYNS